MGETSNEPVKSSLPQQTRPTEPDNDTDVTNSTQRLAQNDPKLVEINLNNMKVYSPFGYSNGLLGEGNRGIGWMEWIAIARRSLGNGINWIIIITLPSLAIELF